MQKYKIFSCKSIKKCCNKYVIILHRKIYENEKIVKKQRIEILPIATTLLELWTHTLRVNLKPKKEFYGRILNPSSNVAQLYIHLKIDETNLKPFRFVIFCTININ